MKIVALAGLMLLSVAATSASLECGMQAPELAPSPSPFAGTSWTLTGMGNGESLRMLATDPPVTLVFLGNGWGLKGDTGCNVYYGIQQWTNRRPDGAELRIVNFKITERGCPTAALFDRESEYRDTLIAARYATFDESRLIIATATGRVLVMDRSE